MSSTPHRSTSRPAVALGLLLLVLGVHLAAAPGRSHTGPTAPPAEASIGVDTAGPATLAGHDDRIDGEELLRTLSALAHDSMAGRRVGTDGNERARALLAARFGPVLEPVAGARTHEFAFTSRRDSIEYEGVNIMGMVRGREHPQRYIVVTAHYDHLGMQDGEVYNGADDNASGSAALVALAEWFRANPPRNSLLFVATDAEEMGLEGARHWVADPPVPLNRIVMNVNLDMVSRSEAGELYAAGTYHYPFLTPLVEEVAADAPVTLLRGHDSPDLPPGDDWTTASDHGPFHRAGIPFIYFGVEDHPGYHHPSDTFEAITPGFYVAAVETVLDFILVVDRDTALIMEERLRIPT